MRFVFIYVKSSNRCYYRTRPGRPEPGPISLNSRPSEMLGQSITNAISPAITKLAEFSENRGLIPSEQQQRSAYHHIGLNSDTKSLMNIAGAFLGSSRPGKSPSFGTKTQTHINDGDINWLPTIRELAPGANSNFGIPKGEGSSTVIIKSIIIYHLSF